jgi:hypothetical protein
MAQVVMSLQVPQSKLRGTCRNTLLKLPRETGGQVLLGDTTYGEDFPGGKEVTIDIV